MTKKPDWNYAPEWANYVAMDADGAWYWYEHEPIINELRDSFTNYTRGRLSSVLSFEQEDFNAWKTTMSKRP